MIYTVTQLVTDFNGSAGNHSLVLNLNINLNPRCSSYLKLNIEIIELNFSWVAYLYLEVLSEVFKQRLRVLQADRYVNSIFLQFSYWNILIVVKYPEGSNAQDFNDVPTVKPISSGSCHIRSSNTSLFISSRWLSAFKFYLCGKKFGIWNHTSSCRNSGSWSRRCRCYCDWLFTSKDGNVLRWRFLLPWTSCNWDRCGQIL